MAIVSAHVEANGWVLVVTHTAGPGGFATYALDPEGTPRLTVTSLHPGFTVAAGAAVSATTARTLIGTKPLRLPVAASNAGVVAPVAIDEADAGGGLTRVRIALSEHVYASDTGLQLAALTGWRSGEAAAEVAVANNSTTVVPLPIMRWALAPGERATAGFDLELLVFSHHPNGLAPVAGVRFTVCDGTTLKAFWATALETSPRDGRRLYRVTVDPTTATALTAGILRCDAEVYPWIGAMRATNPNAPAAPGMAGAAAAGFSADLADGPLTVAYDPAGTRYPVYVFVDPAGATTAATGANAAVDAAGGPLRSTLAAARAVAVALRPATVGVALQVIRNAARTIAAANGQAAQTNSFDGAEIVLVAGTHVFSASSPGVGTTGTMEGWATLRGDPALADPRAGVVLNTGAAAPNLRVARIRCRDLTLGIGGQSLWSTATQYVWLDNVTVEGKPGSTGSTTAAWGGTGGGGRMSRFATNVRWWRTGDARSWALARRVETSRILNAMTAVGCRHIGSIEDGTIAGGAVIGGIGDLVGSPTGEPTVAEDLIYYANDLRHLTGRAWLPPRVLAATAGTAHDSTRRVAFVGNLCERVGGDPQPFFSIGEKAAMVASYNIVEGNSFIGQRCNFFYNDAIAATGTAAEKVAYADATDNQAFVNRVANNAFDWNPSKHDRFNDPDVQAQRSAAGDPRAHGYRPQATGAWPFLYGVGLEGNISLGQGATDNFRLEYYGRRGAQYFVADPYDPGYAAAAAGTGGAGGGDYRPLAGSPLIGRGRSANGDRDLHGGVRSAMFAAGAIGNAVTADVALVPAGARSLSRATGTVVGWSVALLPSGAQSGVVDTAARVELGVALVVAPAGTRHALGDRLMPVILPATVAPPERTLVVSGDFRVTVIEPD